jgi:hypothetical protein
VVLVGGRGLSHSSKNIVQAFPNLIFTNGAAIAIAAINGVWIRITTAFRTEAGTVRVSYQGSVEIIPAS